MAYGPRPRLLAALSLSALVAAAAAGNGNNIGTLAGKVAAVRGTAGLQIRMSAFIEEEADDSAFGVLAPDGTTLADPADGGAVKLPDIVMNGDTHGAPQNETSIAVDPNNPNRVVAGANDYVSRTWSCMIASTPCSALGDGYSGTYYSNDGGGTWAAVATDQSGRKQNIGLPVSQRLQKMAA